MKTPHYIFHIEKLIKNYQTFKKACEKHFNNFKICFSTKTNTNKLTINTLSKVGCGFEIASLREIKLTPKKSFKVMNGPAKTPEELKLAIKENILLQIDSFSEIKKIKNLKTKPTEAMLRISNSNLKFGFEKSQIKKAIEELEKLKINFVGFQLHGATSQKIKDFKENLKTNYKTIRPYLNKIKFLNFGGGYPDNFQLKNLGLTLDDYLKEIKLTFKEFKGTFIFEPGRNLVSDAYTLTTKVISIKEKNETNYAILDAGINILSKITLANFKFNKISAPYTLHHEQKQKAKTFVLAGPLLFNNDIVGKWHGKLSEGDYFEIENVGAYCENLSWNIIYDKPKVI